MGQSAIGVADIGKLRGETFTQLPPELWIDQVHDACGDVQ